MRARRLHSIPFMYCFSPTLVPFPSDWDRSLIDMVGFFFLEGGKTDFKPDERLEAFLAEKDKPVYIGVGSLVVGNVEVCNGHVLDILPIAAMFATFTVTHTLHMLETSQCSGAPYSLLASQDGSCTLMRVLGRARDKVC